MSFPTPADVKNLVDAAELSAEEALALAIKRRVEALGTELKRQIRGGTPPPWRLDMPFFQDEFPRGYSRGVRAALEEAGWTVAQTGHGQRATFIIQK